jgi:hypothetical protein
MVLTLEGDRISAITWFGDRGLFPVGFRNPAACAEQRGSG